MSYSRAIRRVAPIEVYNRSRRPCGNRSLHRASGKIIPIVPTYAGDHRPLSCDPKYVLGEEAGGSFTSTGDAQHGCEQKLFIACAHDFLSINTEDQSVTL